MEARPTGRLRRSLATASTVIAVLDLALYLYTISAQQGGGFVVSWFVVGILVAIVLEVSVYLPHMRSQRLVLIVAGVILIGLGILGLLSIGSPLIIAGILSLIAAASPARSNPSRLHGARRPLRR